MPSLNDYVDHIYVLSMPARSERRELLAKQMAEMNSTYTVVDGVKADNGRLGCTLGHIKVLETAIAAGHKKIFICEDDALFRRLLMTDIAGIMGETNDYDMLFTHSEPPLPLHLNHVYTFKRGAPWCTQFYAAQNLEKIRDYLKHSVEVLGKDGIDYLYRDSKLNVRTTVKEYVFQLDDFSDIELKVFDRFKRKIIHDDFLISEYNVEKATKSFWIGHRMLGDVLGFCAAAHLYSKKVGKPVKVWFDPGRRDAARYFDGVLWSADRTPDMIDCGGDPNLDEWPQMNGVKRFYRFMDPTMSPTKSFDVHFNRPRPPADGKLIGLITHSNTQGDVDPVVLKRMLQEARQTYPEHRIVLIGGQDNKIIPEGAEDLRPPGANINWIIDMVGRLDLLITPQSGPCFIAAGWNVPMWVYRSKEAFWDYTLNYEVYKVDRWFDRPEVTVETPDNYLQLCRQANLGFYEQVKKLIDSKVVIVHRKDFNNIGDFASNPALYFDLPVADVIDIGDDKAIEKYLQLGYWFVVGGGGLFYQEKKWINNITKIIESKKAILWGIGKNTHTNDIKKTYTYPESLKKAALVGLRDRDQKQYQWVPCVSCMDQCFLQRQPGVVSEVLVYNHAGHRIEPLAKSNADFQSVSDCVSYLSGGKKVVTSSYHGAYWSMLLGKKVSIRRAFSNKFTGL